MNPGKKNRLSLIFKLKKTRLTEQLHQRAQLPSSRRKCLPSGNIQHGQGHFTGEIQWIVKQKTVSSIKSLCRADISWAEILWLLIVAQGSVLLFKVRLRVSYLDKPNDWRCLHCCKFPTCYFRLWKLFIWILVTVLKRKTDRSVPRVHVYAKGKKLLTLIFF